MYEHLEPTNVSLRLGPGGGPGAAIAHAKFCVWNSIRSFQSQRSRGDMGV